MLRSNGNEPVFQLLFKAIVQPRVTISMRYRKTWGTALHSSHISPSACCLRYFNLACQISILQSTVGIRNQ